MIYAPSGRTGRKAMSVIVMIIRTGYALDSVRFCHIGVE